MDKARKLTDKELRKLEQEIYELYATSQVEISEKWRKYMQSHKKSLDKLYNDLQEAKKSGDKDAISAAQEKYERAVKNVTLNDKRYKAMINETTAKMANVNQTALDYVNNEMPKVYTLNYNAFGDQDINGYAFTLVNERAVANLAMSDKIELPYKKLDVPKDQRWNAKNINSQLAQGILQGESIDKISKRLQNVTDMNRASAIRNARTMVTGAENKGRQDSFEKAQSDGIIMTRTWIAAHDDRTRAWHLDLHNVEVDVNEPWENEYGKIMYPGDPSADPANVYNCRCAIRAHVKGFAWNGKAIINTASYSNTGIVEGDIENVNPKIMDIVSNNIAKLNNRFTGVKEYLAQGGCYFDEQESDKYGVMSAVTSINNNGPFISRFVFGKSKKNGNIYASVSDFEQYVAKSVSSKWYMPCDESHLKDYLEFHEYGHIVQNYILNRDYTWKNFKTEAELADAYNERCTIIYKELVKCGMQSGIIKDLGSSVDNLSRYSLKKAGQGITSDVFAESFANMLCGSPNEWGRTMEVYLKEKGILK